MLIEVALWCGAGRQKQEDHRVVACSTDAGQRESAEMDDRTGREVGFATGLAGQPQHALLHHDQGLVPGSGVVADGCSGREADVRAVGSRGRADGEDQAVRLTGHAAAGRSNRSNSAGFSRNIAISWMPSVSRVRTPMLNRS